MKTPVEKSSDLHVTIDKEAKVTEDEDENENGSEHPNSPHQKKRQEEDPLFRSGELVGRSGLSQRCLPQCCTSKKGEAFPTEGCGAPSSQLGRQQSLFLRTEVEKLKTKWET